MRILIALLISCVIGLLSFGTQPKMILLVLGFTFVGAVLIVLGETVFGVLRHRRQRRADEELGRRLAAERAQREADDPLLYQRDDQASVPF